MAGDGWGLWHRIKTTLKRPEQPLSVYGAGSLLLLLALLCAPSLARDSSCVNCHEQAVKDWQKSHHYHAMGEATAATVQGSFNDQSIGYQGQQARFYRDGKQLFIEMPNLAGKLTPYPVLYFFGYEPLQQYIFEMAPGKLQFFPFAWDTRAQSEGGQRWFVLHPEQQPHDEFHWSQMGQNWNQMCADCHSTNFVKGFDLPSKTYQSSYDAINVSCAACHGSAEQHLKWAKGDKDIAAKGYPHYIGAKTPLFREDDKGIMQSIAAIKPSKQIEVCASCHSRRSQTRDRGAPHEFFKHYNPSLLTPELYHVDGQIFEEDYVWGSFLQSKMYAAGVTCSNCHNPHSGELKLPKNKTCTQCHSSETFDTTAHHGHKQNTTGSYCVDCHMPATVYMQVDARRDHSFKVPRPDLTRQTGAPNACTGCHQDQSPKWAEQHIKTWHPDSNRLGAEHFAHAFYAADTQEPNADAKLTRIAQNVSYPDIVRASAIARLAQTPGQNAVVAIVRAVRDEDPIKRQAAITASAAYPVTNRWRMLNGLLDDAHQPIRIEAARTLTGMLTQPPESALSEADEKRLKAVLDEYREVQSYQADRGYSHTNLGNLAQELGMIKNAENHYRTAIDVEPVFIPAYINLADIYRVRGDEAQVQSILKQALAIDAEASSAHYAFAMSLVRQGKKDQAISYLHDAATFGANNANFIYTYALLLQDRQRHQDALLQLRRAYELTPNNPDISYSMSQLYLGAKQFDEALFYAKKLAELVPGNAQIEQMIDQIQQMKADQP